MLVVTNFRDGKKFEDEEYENISKVTEKFREYIEEKLKDSNIDLNQFNKNMDLIYDGQLAIAYGKGSLFNKYYDFKSNPITEEEFENDLKSFLNLNKEVNEFNDKFLEIKNSILNPDLKKEEDAGSENNISLMKYEDFNREKGSNILFYGVPGCGKSHHIKTNVLKDVNDEYIERVLFYPDYTYGDFIGQILPEVKDGEVDYKFTPGPFTSILKKAFHDPKHKYYLVIEEINRGNAPAIFGDVFQLLDRVDDENSEYPIGTSDYAITNKNIAENIYNDAELSFYGNKIRIPSNLSIIASMNTSDQNVFTLDNAFQRRWEMELIKNDFDNEEDKDFYDHPVLGTEVTWEKFCTVINEEILDKNNSTMSSEDKRLGVYFVNSKELDESKKFSQKVIKYLWDDAFKFNRDEVFNEGYNSLEYIIKDLDKDNFDKLSIFTKSLQDKLNKKEETESENLKEEQAEDNDSE